MEEGHLQGDLQAGQRGPRDLQVPQLSAGAPPRLTGAREETRPPTLTTQFDQILVFRWRRDLRNKTQNWEKRNLFALTEKLLLAEKICRLLLIWLLPAEGEEHRGHGPPRRTAEEEDDL